MLTERGRIFPETFTAHACFPDVSWFAIRETLFPGVSFCFQDANYDYATRQGILTKIRACEQLKKFCEHEQVNTHLTFASNSSKGQILRALSNRPRSIYQYSNLAPRLSGQTSIFCVVFFVSKSLLGIEGQRQLEKFAILSRKPRSQARILIYRTWPIGWDHSIPLAVTICLNSLTFQNLALKNHFGTNIPLLQRCQPRRIKIPEIANFTFF